MTPSLLRQRKNLLFKVALIFFVTSFAPRLLAAQDGRDVMNDVQMIGTLDGKLNIEMHLNSTGDVSFFKQEGKECIDLQGQYYYHTQLKPIDLTGRLCPANATFFLSAKSGNRETERFEGKWDAKQKKMSGTWTLKSSGKTMHFELTSTEVGLTESTITGYSAILRGFSGLESFEMTTQGGSIRGFPDLWGGTVVFFSPTRVEYYTEHTNSGAHPSHSEYEEVFQLLPSEHGVHVVQLSRSSHSNESGVYYDAKLRVYKFTERDLEEVTETVFPKGFVIGWEAVKGKKSCEVHLTISGILLPTGEKLYWDGSKY